MCEDSTQIAHSPCWHQQSRLLAHDFGSIFLQPVHGGVFTVYVIPNLSLLQRQVRGLWSKISNIDKFEYIGRTSKAA